MVRGVGNGTAARRDADGESPPRRPSSRHQAVVVGYGPVGRTVTRLLRENEIAPTVIELNMDTVKDLKDSGIRAVYGDASHLATLEEAGARHARSVIFTVSGMRAAEESIRLVRELNPRVQILARTAYLRERDALRKAGADQVFSGEGEVALTLTESILASLGATAEQIDRERARVHGDNELTTDDVGAATTLRLAGFCFSRRARCHARRARAHEPQTRAPSPDGEPSVDGELARVDRHADHRVHRCASSVSISSLVVMPPAAVRRRVVARLSARMASRLVPPISPSVSTWV